MPKKVEDGLEEGKKINLETMDDLNSFANQIDEAIKRTKVESENDKAESENEIRALKERCDTLTIAVKGKWRETDTPERRQEQMGKLIYAIYMASPIYGNSRKAHQFLIDQGCVPAASLKISGGAWGDTEWEVGQTKEEKLALGTPLRGDAVTGSYLVPVEYSGDLLRIAADRSEMMGKVTRYPMRAKTMYLPREGTAAGWTWVTNQAAVKTEASPDFEQVTLTNETCASWIAIVDELEEDSLIPLGSLFATQWGEGWGQEFDKQLLNSAASPFTGILQNTGVNILNMDPGRVAFADIEADDFVNLVAQLTTKGKRAGAVYIMHPTVLDKVSILKNANGDPLFKKLDERAPGTINGYPYITTDAMPEIADSAVSTAFIAFGNPKHLVNGDRTGMEFGVFDKTVRRVDYDEIFFRARIRQGFVAGQPAAFAVLKTAAS